MDDFYETEEYQEIVSDAQADYLLDYGRPGGEMLGAVIFVGLFLATVAVVWAKENPQR
ncbi:MAG: hypothetical protein AAFV72_00135 [Cyanobacteria bacterium J06635_1]